MLLGSDNATGAGQAVELRITNTGAWEWVLADTGGLSGGAVSFGAWSTLIAEYEPGATKMRLQVNGGAVQEKASPGTPNSRNQFSIGTRPTGSFSFNGLVSFVGVFPRLLTSGERAEINAAGIVSYPNLSSGLKSDAVLWKDFEDASSLLTNRVGSWVWTNSNAATWSSSDG